MGRSGSTILDTILGQIDGYISVGEIKFIWERSLLENRQCGCGERFSSCPFWTRVFDRAFGGFDAVNVPEMISAMNQTRTRHFPLMLLPGSERIYRRRQAAYLEKLGSLYRAIADESGSDVIVDSSKYPSHAYLLRLVNDLDVRVLHVTRDPRAVANSWLHDKYDPDQDIPVLMPQQPAWLNAIFWNVWNVTIEALGKRRKGAYRQLRYEDLMENPEDRVGEVLEFAGTPATVLPFAGPRKVRLGTNHTVSGNPIRFDTGTIELRADERWRTQLSRSAATTAGLLTWPVRRHFGYRFPITPSRSS